MGYIKSWTIIRSRSLIREAAHFVSQRPARKVDERGRSVEKKTGCEALSAIFRTRDRRGREILARISSLVSIWLSVSAVCGSLTMFW